MVSKARHKCCSFGDFMNKSLGVLISLASVSSYAQTGGDDEGIWDLSLEDLLNIEIVSASKKAEKPFEAPLSISAITANEIHNAGVNSWGEALRLLPGVIVREQSSGNYDIHIRGFDNVPPDSQLPFLANTVTLVMIDYRIVYNYFAGGTFWETLPLSLNDVERIEVVRGPSSPMYGPNAVSGVIHIISKKPQNDGWAVHGNIEAGENNTRLGSVLAQYQADTWSLQGSYSQQNRDRATDQYYSLVQGNYVNNALNLVEFDTGQPSALNAVRFPDQSMAQDIETANISVEFKPDDKWQIGLTAGMEDSEVQKAYFENGLTPLNTVYSDTKFFDAKASDGKWTSQLSYLSGDQGAYGIAGWNWDFSTLDMMLEYDHEVSETLSIRPGISYRKATYDAVFIKGERDMTTKAASFRADYRPDDNWRVIAAVRADQYDTPDTTEISSQLSVSYKASQNTHWRFNYGRSSRAPFMLDTFQDSSFTTPNGLLFELLGNQDLEPLHTTTFELGVRHNLSETQQIELEVFRAKNKNYSDVELLFAGPDGAFFRTTGKYANLPIEPTITGATLSYNHFFSANTYLKSYITITDSKIKDHIQQPEAPPAPTEPGDGPQDPPPGPPPGLPAPMLIDLDDSATPGYYGGFMFNHRMKDWNFNFNVYAYEGHTMTHVIDDQNIESKIIANLTVRYHLSRNSNVYLAIKNLNDAASNEFLYTDNTGRHLGIGLDVKF